MEEWIKNVSSAEMDKEEFLLRNQRPPFPTTPLICVFAIHAWLYFNFVGVMRIYIGLTLILCCAVGSLCHILALQRSEQRTLQKLCQKYDLSRLGFLPAKPVTRLDSNMFPACEVWEKISEELPKIIREQKGKLYRERVMTLPCLTKDELSTVANNKESLRRCYVLFGQLVHAFVHCHRSMWDTGQNGEATKERKVEETCGLIYDSAGRIVVPAQLAIPFHFSCEKLNMPTVLTATGTDCWNWCFPYRDEEFLNDLNPDRFSVADLHSVSSITGTDTERFFHMIPCAMQAAAGNLLFDILRIPWYLSRRVNAKLLSCLKSMQSVLSTFRDLFNNIPKLVDIRIFRDVYRHLLNGFYPDGIILRLDAENQVGIHDIVATPKGPSAGQSAIFIIFDLLLGVRHARSGEREEPSDNTVMRAFQSEMREYMPYKHRLLIQHFETALSAAGYCSVGHYISSGNGGKLTYELSDAFDGAATALRDLRQEHLRVVCAFLSSTNTGTGASAYRSLLQESLDNTTATVEEQSQHAAKIMTERGKRRKEKCN